MIRAGTLTPMDESAASFTYIAPVLHVADPTRSVTFYRDRLGFDVEFVYEGFYADLCREGCHVHLHCTSPTQRDQEAFERSEQLDVCVVVRDAGSLSTKFRAADVPFTVGLREMPYGSEFYIRDPDGYVLGFVEPAPSL